MVLADVAYRQLSPAAALSGFRLRSWRLRCGDSPEQPLNQPTRLLRFPSSWSVARTVETHRAHVIKQLKVHSIPETFHFAAQNGLLSGATFTVSVNG